MSALLLDHIAQHIELSPSEKTAVLEHFQTELFAPKTKLLEPQQTCTKTYFVTKGLLRSTTLDSNGNEHIIAFAPSGWWINDMYSFFSSQPSNVYIISNEETETLSITKNQREALFARVPKMERYFRILIENALVSNQQRLIDNLSLSAECRFDSFMQRYPNLSHCLPQKQIASYLGVTPEFFSKMKTNYFKNKE